MPLDQCSWACTEFTFIKWCIVRNFVLRSLTYYILFMLCQGRFQDSWMTSEMPQGLWEYSNFRLYLRFLSMSVFSFVFSRRTRTSFPTSSLVLPWHPAWTTALSTLWEPPSFEDSPSSLTAFSPNWSRHLLTPSPVSVPPLLVHHGVKPTSLTPSLMQVT